MGHGILFWDASLWMKLVWLSFEYSQRTSDHVTTEVVRLKSETRSAEESSWNEHSKIPSLRIHKLRLFDCSMHLQIPGNIYFTTFQCLPILKYNVYMACGNYWTFLPILVLGKSIFHEVPKSWCQVKYQQNGFKCSFHFIDKSPIH